MQTASYGSWESPITSDLIVAETIVLDAPCFDGDDIYWAERRPANQGRITLVRRTRDGKVSDVTPREFNVRTRVHEYGGGAFLVDGGIVYFSHFDDQRVYRLDPGKEPRPITPELDLRYADAVMDRTRKRLICVREDHIHPDEVTNTIVGLNNDGDEAGGHVLVSGTDFVSTPRLSPDGKQLAWQQWNHPNMPWDGCELWVGTFDAQGNLTDKKKIAGGENESVFQPEWAPDGTLYFVSDRSGWWNLYRLRGEKIQAVCPMQAEFGEPQWVFGMRTYAFDSAERILCTYTQDGTWYLATLNTTSGKLAPISTSYTDIGGIRARGGRALFLAGAPTKPAAVVQYDFALHEFTELRRSASLKLDEGYLSIPQAIEYPTTNGLSAHAFYYAPKNLDFVAPATEKPPLIVASHGGPTGAASTTLALGIQYWTSRGFAFLDVNYGGSTGYGRAYRERLNNNWGIVDVDDCVNGARYLAAQGLADAGRLAIRGGSAGGYTTLAALTFRDVFQVGASHFGISDLEAMAKETHKFESRYLDHIVASYPEGRAVYVERSPIHYVERLNSAMILFQGLEDKIVPPNQAEMMFDAVKKKGLPVAYLPFAGEQHGFRRAENIKRALDAELYFYGRVFHFPMADEVEPVKIENLKE